MTLSRDSARLLQWLRRHDEWKYQSEIETQYKRYDHRSFRALLNLKFIDWCIFEDEIPEYDDYGDHYYPKHYRISDLGKAYLDGQSSRRLPELREWIAIGISTIALIVSIVTLILQQAQ